jgi:hypothetical protein
MTWRREMPPLTLPGLIAVAGLVLAIAAILPIILGVI